MAARLVAVRGLLYIIVQQLRTMEEGDTEADLEADPELSLSQVLLLQHTSLIGFNIGTVFRSRHCSISASCLGLPVRIC